MKKSASIQRVAFVAAVLLTVFILNVVNTAIAANASDSWYKNGATMNGSHSANFVGILDRKIDGNSNVVIPPGTMESITVFVYLYDRCRNQDGTWQAWNPFVETGTSRPWATTVSYSGQGTYQNCIYGHQYRNQSVHAFYYPAWSLNEAHWLCSGDPGVC